jgi:hypothetical protein
LKNAALRVYFGLIAILVTHSTEVAGQGTLCAGIDPDSGPLGYREQSGDLRCEGLYRSPVAGTALELLSFTGGALAFDLGSDPVLVLTGPDIRSLKADKFRVQARALPLSTFYRMDATVRANSAFNWPTAMLKAVKLTADSIGVLGWFDRNSTKVYVPLQVSGKALPVTRPSATNAVLRSSVDLEKFYWRSWPEGKSTLATGWQSTRLSYRAGQPIRLELKADTGITFFEFSGKMVGSDDWTSLVAEVYQP